ARVDVFLDHCEVGAGSIEAIRYVDGIPGASGKPGERVDDEDGLAAARFGDRLLESGPVVRPPARQVFVVMHGDDRIAVAGGVGATPLDLLLDAVALLGIGAGREPRIEHSLGHGRRLRASDVWSQGRPLIPENHENKAKTRNSISTAVRRA